jgi:hypothetical protein
MVSNCRPNGKASADAQPRLLVQMPVARFSASL